MNYTVLVAEDSKNLTMKKLIDWVITDEKCADILKSLEVGEEVTYEGDPKTPQQLVMLALFFDDDYIRAGLRAMKPYSSSRGLYYGKRCNGSLTRPATGLEGFPMCRYEEMWQILLRFKNPQSLAFESVSYGTTMFSKIMWVYNMYKFDHDWDEFAQIVFGCSILNMIHSELVMDQHNVTVNEAFSLLNHYNATEPKLLAETCDLMYKSDLVYYLDLNNDDNAVDYAPYYDNWSMFDCYVYFLIQINKVEVDSHSPEEWMSSDAHKCWEERASIYADK